ncbi:12069_t:CDS:2 [Ambispora leptoticha]|uniref:12069_t:CDS:1 n=1 Tax=Ambispora leptoticha TaxID=144679 RepID=A0A9N8W936_9GLOM|nr:12069_t:CDS:2 [Ambispora leptoticha]
MLNILSVHLLDAKERGAESASLPSPKTILARQQLLARRGNPPQKACNVREEDMNTG